MDNKTIYKKTIKFSLWQVLWDLIAFAIFAIFSAAGFAIANQTTNYGLAGLGIGAILGGICAGILLHFVSYSYKAGQIAMMTEGIVKGKLPEDTVKAGKEIVKERFSTVAAYYAATGAIKAVFRQIGNGITAVGQAVGGDNGGAVGSTISGVINTIIDYLCDCCLGWVFYKKDEKATKATLEGAVIFFKHGKTLVKNLGRIFGIGLLSFVVIGGVFFGLSYLIFQAFPDGMNSLSAEITETIIRLETEVPEFVSNVTYLSLVCSGIIGVVIWGIIHSTFIRPFVLVGVLRNFIKSGQAEKISEADFDKLDQKSKKFAKLHSEAA